MAIVTKKCCTCGVDKSLSAFGKSKSCKDGYEPRCKTCRSEAHKRHNKTPLTDEQKERYYQTRVLRPVVAPAVHACAKCGLEKPITGFSRQATAKYGVRNTCRDCQKMASRDYRLRNPTYAANNCRDYYTRKKGVNMRPLDPEWFDLVNREAEDVRLRRQRVTGVKWHRDHVVALAEGGLHAPENWQVIPALVNIKKGAKPLGRFFGGN